MEAFLQDGDFDFGIFGHPEINKPNLQPVPKQKIESGYEPAPKRRREENGRSTRPQENDRATKPQEIDTRPESRFSNSKFAEKKKPLTKENITWDYNPKVAWEPDESDIANMISIEKNDNIFKGEFSETGLSDRVVSLLVNNMSLKQPTVIQHHAIPQIMEGHDVLVKAETGSGKTMTYVLPVMNVLGDMEPRINRNDGAYAIILAPTRELVAQIYDVVCRVAKTWIWVVPGYLSGGENKSSEKNRLRKGVNVLVATPGRLMDHMQTTTCFKYNKLRFLVLDEADRLLDMGLGPQISDIVTMLRTACGDTSAPAPATHSNFYTKNAANNSNFNKNNRQAQAERKEEQRPTGTHLNKSSSTSTSATSKPVAEPEPEKPRLNKTTKFEYDDVYVPAPKKQVVLVGKKFQTIMASATLHNGIRQLAYVALHKPVYLGLTPKAVIETKRKREDIESGQNYETPLQLTQFYTAPKTKDRVSCLVQFLQHCASKNKKVVVFVASCASANFYHGAFTGTNANSAVLQNKRDEEGKKIETEELEHIALIDAPILKLHGDLSQVDRSSATAKFRNDSRAMLITTDVSARGLDFPDVDWIVQYDPPADTKDYIHRVGRTARMGRKGKSLIFLTNEELGYLEYLKTFGIDLKEKKIEQNIVIQHLLENFVIDTEEIYQLAKSAFASSVRAYATHTAATKHIFNVANLHVGHLAKAFCLREKPSDLNANVARTKQTKTKERQEKKREEKTKSSYEALPKRIATSEFDAGL